MHTSPVLSIPKISPAFMKIKFEGDISYKYKLYHPLHVFQFVKVWIKYRLSYVLKYVLIWTFFHFSYYMHFTPVLTTDNASACNICKIVSFVYWSFRFINRTNPKSDNQISIERELTWVEIFRPPVLVNKYISDMYTYIYIIYIYIYLYIYTYTYIYIYMHGCNFVQTPLFLNMPNTK